MELEVSVEVAAPAAKVWAVLAAVERWPEWTASVTSVRRLDGGELAVGSRARIRQPGLPAAAWRVTALEPGRYFEWEASGPGMKAVAAHEVRASVSGGSAVRLSLRQTGPLSWLLGFWLAKVSRRYVEMEAQGLKRRCEGA